MDRLGFVSEKHGSGWGLIKLRDLPKNYWNVDDLFILTDTLDQARELERIAEEEDWKADNVTLLQSDDERGHQLGQFPPSGYVISFWWD